MSIISWVYFSVPSFLYLWISHECERHQIWDHIHEINLEVLCVMKVRETKSTSPPAFIRANRDFNAVCLSLLSKNLVFKKLPVYYLMMVKLLWLEVENLRYSWINLFFFLLFEPVLWSFCIFPLITTNLINWLDNGETWGLW